MTLGFNNANDITIGSPLSLQDQKRRIGQILQKGIEKGQAYVRLKIISFGDESVGKSCLVKRYCEERFIDRYISTIGVDYGVKRVELKKSALVNSSGAPLGTPSGFFGNLKDNEMLEVRVNFWDLAGADEYIGVRDEFYKDTQGALLVFDVNKRESFDHLVNWIAEARKHINGCADERGITTTTITPELGKKRKSSLILKDSDSGAIGERKGGVSSRKNVLATIPFNEECFYTIVCGNKVDLPEEGGRDKRTVSEVEAKKWALEHGFAYYETSAKSGQNINQAFMDVFIGSYNQFYA